MRKAGCAAVRQKWGSGFTPPGTTEAAALALRELEAAAALPSYPSMTPEEERSSATQPDHDTSGPVTRAPGHRRRSLTEEVRGSALIP